MNAMNPISRWVSAGIAGLASLAAFAEPPEAAPAEALPYGAGDSVGLYGGVQLLRDLLVRRHVPVADEGEVSVLLHGSSHPSASFSP